MRQNFGWAIGYKSLALPVAAGAFATLGLTLRPKLAAISMSGSSLLVALNALDAQPLVGPTGAINRAVKGHRIVRRFRAAERMLGPWQ